MELLDLKYQLINVSESDRILVIKDNMLVVDSNQAFLTSKHLDGDALYLFKYDGINYFLAENLKHNLEYKKMSIADVRSSFNYEMAMMLSVAMQLARFYESNKYCGKCGNKMNVSDIERAMVCTCGNHTYPKIAPAVIVAIIDRDNDSILLTKGIHMKDANSYGLVAGFVEVGETFEESVYREVKEEVNLKIKNLKYFANQPWGFGDNIMIAYTAELDGSNEFVMQESELMKVWWQKRKDIIEVDRPLSVGHKMVQAFRRGEI